MTRTVAMMAACAALAFGPVAYAQEDEAAGWSLSGDIGVVSDYQYRGYSLSGGDWAVQGGLTLNAPHGFYFGVWGSEIEEVGIGADGDGALIEVDLSVGRAFSAHGWDWDVALLHYGYPDGDDLDYFEIPVSASRTVGDFTTTLGVQYAPTQDNLGDQDNIYFYVGGDYAPEHWPVSVNAQIGHEDGAFADGKLDWQLGAAKDIGPVSLSVTYADSDGPGSESSVTGGISLGF
ncbi:MAG: TorF family putative porin [Caulobacter sp.]|nr:TorF family putative porin [Caulobacter sp.]